MPTRLLQTFGRLGLLLVLSAGAAAHAVTLDDLIGQLDSDDLITRDTATDELRKRLSDTTDAQTVEAARALELEAAEALRTRELSLEQRVRLFDALRDRFFRTPRGAMGVQFVQPQIRPMGVELDRVIEGFPAAERGALKRGDVVTSVGGVPLIGPEMAQLTVNGLNRASERLRHMVISHDPDETIEMTLVRPIGAIPDVAARRNVAVVPGGGDLITEGPGKNADVVTVTVPLGSFDRLRQGNVLDQGTLEGAWKQRTERLGIPPITSRTLGTPLTLREWVAHRRVANQDAPALLAGDEQAGADEFVGTAIAGGNFPVNELEVRQVPAPIEVRLQRAARLANRADGIDPGLRKGPARAGAGAPVVAQGAEGARVQEIMELLQAVAALNRQRETLLARAADLTVSDKQRRAAAQDASKLQEDLNKMEVLLKQRLIENANAAAEPKK